MMEASSRTQWWRWTVADQQTIEQRLSALEAEVAALKDRVGATYPNGDRSNHLPDPVTNDEVFQKMLEYGREARSAEIVTDDAVENAIASFRRRTGNQGP